MAIFFNTNDPSKLLAEFRKAIEEGRVITWSCDKDGDFTHTPEQWQYKAWFRPTIEENRLALYVLNPKDMNVTSEIYAIYHGRFIESMLVHCDKLFTDCIASALAKPKDKVAPPITN